MHEKRIRMYSDSLCGRLEHSIRHVIKPKEIFQGMIAEHTAFTNLKGYSERWLQTQSDCTTEWRYVKHRNKGQKSDFWIWSNDIEERACIIHVPSHIRRNEDYPCAQHLKMIWTEPALRNKGYASKALRAIFDIADEVNQICRTQYKYNGADLNCTSFYVWFCPNAFHAPTWSVEDVNSTDWSNSDKATADVVDELETELPELQRPMTWKELRDWYIRLGAEVDPTHHLWVDDAWQNTAPIPESTISERSLQLGRYGMRYPPKQERVSRKCLD